MILIISVIINYKISKNTLVNLNVTQKKYCNTPFLKNYI